MSNLYPVRTKILTDFNRGLLFGRLKQYGFLFKRGDIWGDWPLQEILEYETLATVMFSVEKLKAETDRFKQAEIAASLGISKATLEKNALLSKSMSKAMMEMPEAVKQKNMAREKAYQEYMAKKHHEEGKEV